MGEEERIVQIGQEKMPACGRQGFPSPLRLRRTIIKIRDCK